MQKEILWTKSFISACIGNFLLFFAFYLLVPVFPLYLIEKYENQIIDSFEKFFEKISFKEIIREKIQSYTLEEMEEVTLKLAKRELRYVEIFGIPLGMLISIFQIIF